jgi:inner membrane protein
VQGPSHLVLSWFFADSVGVKTARDRAIVAWAGLAPDGDVLAYVAALLYYRLDQGMAFENVWQVVHHRYTHGMGFVVLTGVAAYSLASPAGDRQSRITVALVAMLASAIHNFCDLVGGGPTWPIYPLWPLSPAPWSVSWSWTIGEWPNIVILAACLAGTLLYAWLAGRSPFECFGTRADRWLVGVVRQQPSAAQPPGRWLRWIIWGALLLATIAVLAPLGFQVGV